MIKRLSVLVVCFLFSALTVFTVSADSGDVILSGDDWAVHQYVYGETQPHYICNYDNPAFKELSPFFATTEDQIIDIVSDNLYDLSNPDAYYILRLCADERNRGINVNFVAYDRVRFGDTLNYYLNDIGYLVFDSPGNNLYAAQFRITSDYLSGTSTTALFVSNAGVNNYDHTNTWIGDYYYNAIITNIPNLTYNGQSLRDPIFAPQITGSFDFKDGYLSLFTHALTSGDFDNRVYLEIYDALPAIEQLIYKPVKYVYPLYAGHSPVITGHKVDDYLRPLETGLSYTVTVDTLVKAGCLDNNPYVARAYCFDDKGQPYEICNIEFALDGDSFYNFIDTDGDGAPDVRKDSDGILTDIATGKVIDPDELSYNFGYGLTDPTDNVYDGVPEYDFDVDLSDDIVAGAGLIRTLFDKLIKVSGLSGFLITVLAISIASWFVFGRRA